MAVPRPASLAYLTQLAQAADALGYDGVLTPTGAHCEDAWIVTAALIAATRRLRFLVAFRPGLVSPVLAAQMAATFQRLSGGRLLLNVVTGGSDAEQRGYGDVLDHDERYERAAGVPGRGARRRGPGSRSTTSARYHEVRGGHLRQPPDPMPGVYFGGSSEPALKVAAKHADTYLTWGEPVPLVAEKMERVRERAASSGREVRFGLRIHVLSRDTSEEAWRAADALIAGLDDATVAAGQQRLRSWSRWGSGGCSPCTAATAPGWSWRRTCGPASGLVRGGAGTALVGSHEEVAERIAEYRAAGIEEFVLSGYPHLEEAYTFAECVRPLL